MLIDGFETTKLAWKILRLLNKYHRSTQNSLTCGHNDVESCFGYQYRKIHQLILTHQPISFILPAFPAKSPNFEKTAGRLPDLGESLALSFLNNICKEIKKFYRYGADIKICSDGRVFSDLVEVPDEDVNAYGHAIKQIIKNENLNFLSTLSLDDCYHQLNYEVMRNQIITEFGESLIDLKNKVKTHPESTLLFNGIHRFIFEDRLNQSGSISKNKIRHLAKEITYQIMQRSNAWSNLLKNKFPNAIRLSIHPQSCGSEKLGIMLLESYDVWATPWHRVVLKYGSQYRLIRKKEAEYLQAKPIFNQQQFSHYMM